MTARHSFSFTLKKLHALDVLAPIHGHDIPSYRIKAVARAKSR